MSDFSVIYKQSKVTESLPL